ncbi:hypothetical protein QLX08_007568 [Tetragonisca angustula]|uniref:Uncharacterized protein n=1 Tax=Tetragonisca angustula TaxID=166442 RepID=A0AAW0ZQB9_9HYME
MWLIFPMVPLLIRAILANSEIDDTTLPDIMELGNDSNDILTDNHTEKSWNEIWKVWKKGSLKVPFDPWSGKRAKGYTQANVDLQGKGTKLVHDSYDPDAFADGFNNVKRIKARGNIFNSWGGKRAEKLNNRDDPFLSLTKSPGNFRLMEKDGLVRRNGGKYDDEKLAIQMKNWLSTVCNTWEKKHDCWHCRGNDKKAEQHYKKPKGWGPWFGKRSLKAYIFRLGNEYFAVPTYSIKDESFSPFRKRN